MLNLILEVFIVIVEGDLHHNTWLDANEVVLLKEVKFSIFFVLLRRPISINIRESGR